MKTVVTIGVYGWDVQAFLTALQRADVRLLIEVRYGVAVRHLRPTDGDAVSRAGAGGAGGC